MNIYLNTLYASSASLVHMTWSLCLPCVSTLKYSALYLCGCSMAPSSRREEMEESCFCAGLCGIGGYLKGVVGVRAIVGYPFCGGGREILWNWPAEVGEVGRGRWF